MSDWKHCKKILCIRPDNMGDLLMSSPAIRALKESFNCSITVLTSSMAAKIAQFIPEVDEILIYDVPWVKSAHADKQNSFDNMIRMLKEKKFDAAVVFTVFSQNPMPSIMLAYLADIPRRLAHCRENPYELLTDWVIEEEPYAFIRHQVKRDRDLVKHVGATVKDDRLKLTISNLSWQASYSKLLKAGLSTEKPWIIFHPGVSEKKREYPIELWAEAGKMIVQQLDYQIVITGTGSERKITERIESDIGENALSVAGMFNLHELIGLIQHSPLVISVNTGIIHIAAATQTKIIVLYALTNPQHTPWKAIGKILPYSIPQDLQSKNQVLQFVQQTYFHQTLDMIQPEEITAAAREILIDHQHQLIPELVISSTVVL